MNKILSSIFLLPLFFQPVAAANSAEDADRTARTVVETAIEAMGGDAYREVRAVQGSGRYFRFQKGRQAFTRFEDWTVYQPLLSRFRLGEGSRQLVQIVNLDLAKGWTLEGEDEVKEMTEEELKDFRNSVKKDIDYLFRHRLDEEGLSLFYYGADDIAGSTDRNLEAVEFIDATNQSIIVYFDRRTHLPAIVETTFTDKLGLRHKREKELSNWHEIQGIMVPLNHRTFTDGEKSEEIFFESVQINPAIPPGHFTRPTVKEK